MRVGLGLDAHRFGGGRPLLLGTVAVEHPLGLEGHSDADVVAHAVCDAMLAASGQPDIGALFPPGDPDWADAPGARLLAISLQRSRAAGFRIVNVHAVVICERPRLSPYREAIEAALSAILEAPVGLHATTTDGMGFTGRGEGIACQAVALAEGGP
ncbi:MAG: 2-C-methyl-D-erythritol 2,4-cyclodiphosphate synthase [Miltoncostaeaceae bacterium]|jgi:2-C-methyl-D-erythritol 2,4-cyclodiphosphate synthase|nr:2-C-methyl-D-erythritol 2,4-cyclodiphosphate synthase [Miltoncostaeaceae bacterium]